MEKKNKKRSYNVSKDMMDTLQDPWSKKKKEKFVLPTTKKKTVQKEVGNDVEDFEVRQIVDKFNKCVFGNVKENICLSFCSEEVISLIEEELAQTIYLSSVLMSMKGKDRDEFHKVVDVTLFQTIDKGKSFLRKHKQAAQSMQIRMLLVKEVKGDEWKIDKLKIKAIESMDY